MPIDRLDALLSRFHLEARVFHSGLLCGTHEFDTGDGAGHMHVVRRGPLTIANPRGRPVRVEEPSLVLYPGPMAHRFICDPKVGAEMVCATVRIGEGGSNPLLRSLPAFVVIPLAAMEPLEPTLELLFAEAFAARCGRQAAVNRLFEVVMIQVLRFAMVEGRTSTGMLAGLAHPALAKAIVAMHERPGFEWTLESLAARAGMSRSRFAAAFRETVGVTPGAYLADWRLAVARDLLRRGKPLKVVANEVGYGSSVALSRAFRSRTGRSPRAWKALAAGAGPPPRDASTAAGA